MNKLERYSLHSGLKISKPFVNNCFFPVIQDKYLTFNSSSLIQSKHYEYWQEVIDIITPFLKEKGISILQLGSEKDPVYEGVYRMCGLANFNQNSYIINKSLLHFNSCDHFSYLSAHSKIPIVSLFSHEPSDSFCFPLASNSKLIDSPKDKNFSYSFHESPKTINKIKPLSIAKNILKSLNIKTNFENLSQVHVGSSYNIRVIEIVPDFIPDSTFLKNSLVNIRMDLHFDENNVFQFAQGRKLGIILNKPLSSDFCQAARNSIARITLDVTDGVDLNFLKILKKLQIPYELFVKDSSKLQSLRLENMDEEISLFERKTKKDLDSSAVICNNAIMKSSKILISNGKRFASKAHWVLNKEISSEYQEVIDNSDFWEDLDYYIIYNKENKNAKGKTKGK